jgi:prepilin-type N-terminal cleavage/methylation domain-containing protein
MISQNVRTTNPTYWELSRHGCRDAGSKAAFTLIELLTVIAIIGILAAILIPVTGEVRERVKRTQCQSNIRQQLIAMHMFSEDNINQHDKAGYWNVIEASNDNAPIDLYPAYTDEFSIFICPSTQNIIRTNVRDKQGRLTDLFTNAADREDNRGGHSYEYLGIYGTGEMTGIVKRPSTTLGLESVTVLVFDGDDAGLQNCPDPVNNHGDAGWNWGFVAGNVEWVTRARTNEVSARSYHSATRCP